METIILEKNETKKLLVLYISDHVTASHTDLGGRRRRSQETLSMVQGPWVAGSDRWHLQWCQPQASHCQVVDTHTHTHTHTNKNTKQKKTGNIIRKKFFCFVIIILIIVSLMSLHLK
jgi:hypothetical protein